MIVKQPGNMVLPVRMVWRGTWRATRRAMFSFHSTRVVAEGAPGGSDSSTTSGSGSKSKYFKVIYICIHGVLQGGVGMSS